MNRVQTTEVQLATFFESARSGVQCVRELRDRYNKQMAFDFSSLHFFWPGENKTSEILAFFLNPKASHGQGCAFLECFCSKFISNLEIGDCSTAQIRTEYSTNESRRIDIVIKFPESGELIGIENKIWAGDQLNQLGHYSRFLEKESDGRYHLIYLSPYGKDPSDISISAEDFKQLLNERRISILSYQEDIISLFGDFIQVCVAENVQAFLKDFQKYLKQQYRGETVMSDQDYIREFIVKSENRLIALEVANQIYAVKEALWQNTVEQLKSWAANNDVILTDVMKNYSEGAARYTSLLSLSVTGSAGWRLRFEFQNPKLTDLYVILHGDNNLVGMEKLMEARKSLDFPNEYRDAPNINRVFFPYNKRWSRDVCPWKAMGDIDETTKENKFASAIISEFEKARAVMGAIV